MSTHGEEGWCTDPFGRHEARWLSFGKPTKLVRDGGVETYDEFKDLMQHHDSDNPDNPYYTGDVAWNPRNWESYTFEQQAQIVSFAEFPNSNVSAFTFLSAQTIVPYTIKWAMLP